MEPQADGTRGSSAGPTTDGGRDRPNVLFLMTDQHRFDVLGYAGDDVVRTPTLDRLAETGVVFESAYTPSPLCVPARHAVRTGQLPRTYAERGFEAAEGFHNPTYPLRFGQQGYATVSAGEEHFPGWHKQQGWLRRVGQRHGVSRDRLPEPDWDVPTARGRDDPLRGTLRHHINNERAGIGDGTNQVWDRRTTGDIEALIDQRFIAPYEDRAATGPARPLLLKHSLNQPHYPFLTDEEKFRYYLNRVEPYLESPTTDHPVLTPGKLVPGEDVHERYLRRATAAYYGMVETVDELFGRTIDALEAAGEDLDEWVIVFTADHGEFLGQRGQWNKRQFYEETARVPLLIRYPERFDPGRIETNVTTCDIYATLCDLAGIPVPDDRDSRSLVPLLDGDEGTYRERHGPHADEAISQLPGGRYGGGFDGIEQDHLMIKRGDLKYCHYGDDGPEVLFDLEADPGETENRAEDPAYADAMAEFRERRGSLGYGPNADPEYETAGYRS